MTKITWLGEDVGNVAGPSFTIWNNIKFPKGEAVEVKDERMIAKAKSNQFFKVSDHEAPAQEDHPRPTRRVPRHGKDED